MKLFHWLALSAALAITVQSVQAADTTSQYKLRIGSTAPAGYRNAGVLSNWKQLGLAEPAAGSHWVKIGDRYVQVSNSDGTIKDVQPTVK